MKNLRIMLAYLAIGSSAALGCAFEVSSEPDTALESPIAANQGEQSVQAAPDSAITWYKRGNAFIKQAEAGDWVAYDLARDALQKCIEKDPNMTACFGLLAIANRPRPGCLSCGAPAANVRAPNVPTLAALPLTSM